MKRCTPPLIAFFLSVQAATACSVPVFRYALEHWKPDPFMVAVFYRGELTDEQIGLLEKLDSEDPRGSVIANVMVKAIDVDHETDPSLRRLWELQEAQTLPWMVVHAPARGRPPQRIWAGELTGEAIERLLESPARTEIAQRLIAGESVVWAFVDSGDRAGDDAAYERLTSHLAHLQTTLRLPEIEEADLGELSVVPEALRMVFSAVRIARDDPREELFIAMLEHAGGASAAEASTPAPMAIPVFGRGRAIDALIGTELDETAVEDACRFLTGACQCTVKAQNPGVDLLMSIDWDGNIRPTSIDETPPPLVGLDGFVPDGHTTPPDGEGPGAEHPDVAVATTAASNSDTDAARATNAAGTKSTDDNRAVSRTPVSPVGRNTLIVLGVLVLLAIGGTMILLPRGR